MSRRLFTRIVQEKTNNRRSLPDGVNTEDTGRVYLKDKDPLMFKMNMIDHVEVVVSKSASLLYWKNTAVGNGWSLKVADHLSNREERGLKNYIDSRIAYGDVWPNTWGQYDCFAGLAAQTRVSHERTDNQYQFLGQLVMPVFRYVGTHEVLVGVIELVTFFPKDSYIEEFNQINMLLKREKLATAKKIKIDYGDDTIWTSWLPRTISTDADLRACLADASSMGSLTIRMFIINMLLKREKLATAKKIKIDYGDDTIWFPLPLESRTTYIWKNVTERFNTLNHRAFQIMYKDCYGYHRTISTDADLRACLADASSMGSLTIRMFIVRKA
ncbi:PB1 domain-containing protein [Tanacetum coccineum]|uniref:PB1 domain-containing protein n=1 Tax=Tanacetum coccineum TaxID=301880 RepID=A0ABQ4YLU1_9ASTR